jgi:uncharacterized protein YjbI with pentapeptide repeats
MVKRKKITDEELQIILADHKVWLLDNSNGKQANLSGLNLQNSNLSGLNLKGVHLRNVDLSFSNLENANLSDSDLSDSDIVLANLRGIILSNSNLSNVNLQETDILQGPPNDKGFSRLAELTGANFFRANLSKTNLTKANLSKSNFTEAILHGTNFCNTTLIKTNFKNADLENADFSGAILQEANVISARLTNTNFNNTNITGIKYNNSLKKSEYVKFRGARIENSYGSPVFKRFTQDQDYLYEYQSQRPLLFNLWYYSSMCGRSIGLWVFWSFMIALFFGAVYSNYPSWDWYAYISPELNISERSLFTPYYFSIVTFTTLGFGDVLPMDLAGEVWVTLEVIIGYIMLGGLISIFSNKLAQRS